MKKTLLTLTAASMMTASLSSAAFAARAIGADPDHNLTIAERQHLLRLQKQGKIDNIYGDHANRLEAIRHEQWQKRKNRQNGVSSTNN